MDPKTYSDLFCRYFLQNEDFQRRVFEQCCPRWFFDIPYNPDCRPDGCLKCWFTAIDSVPDLK